MLDQPVLFATAARETRADSLRFSLDRLDGTSSQLYARGGELRRILERARTGFLTLQVGEDEVFAMFAERPRNALLTRLHFSEVAPDETVAAYVFVDLAPAGDAYEAVDPWIRVSGPVESLRLPLEIEPGASELLALDISLPQGCELLTPPEQPLYRLGQSTASQELQLKVLFMPGPVAYDPNVAMHVAIRRLANRHLRLCRPCRCTPPRVTITATDAWRQGELEICEVEGCCFERVKEAVSVLPGISQTVRTR